MHTLRTTPAESTLPDNLHLLLKHALAHPEFMPSLLSIFETAAIQRTPSSTVAALLNNVRLFYERHGAKAARLDCFEIYANMLYQQDCYGRSGMIELATASALARQGAYVASIPNPMQHGQYRCDFLLDDTDLVEVKYIGSPDQKHWERNLEHAVNQLQSTMARLDPNGPLGPRYRYLIIYHSLFGSPARQFLHYVALNVRLGIDTDRILIGSCEVRGNIISKTNPLQELAMAADDRYRLVPFVLE